MTRNCFHLTGYEASVLETVEDVMKKLKAVVYRLQLAKSLNYSLLTELKVYHGLTPRYNVKTIAIVISEVEFLG